MDQDKDTDNPEYTFELAEDESADETADEPGSVDDFIRELEAKEKDLHITSETTFIELASEFEENEVPDFIREELSAKPPRPEKPALAKPDAAAIVKRLEAEMSALKSENNTLRNESNALLKKIAGFKEERTELLENAQRRLRDFESYKARNERERSESFQRQLSNLATQMLPALDNLDRALEFASDLATHKDGEFAQFFDGIVLVNQQVNEVLAGMGIVPIATVGEQFDPHLHEAVAIDESEDVAPNTITSELLRGFRIGDHVIRHSMVKVSQAPKPELPEPASADPGQNSEPDGEGEAETTVFGEFDPDQITGAEPAGVTETGEPDDSNESECVDFAIERNGEVEKPAKGRKDKALAEESTEDQ